jgi:hypothetical protein
MSVTGLQSVATLADLQEIDGNRSSTATQKLGNAASPQLSVKDEHKVNADPDHDGQVLSVAEMFAQLMQRQDATDRQVAAMVANTLPSPAGINSSSGVARQGTSLSAALRSQSTAPAKNSVASRVVTTITPSEEKSTTAAAHIPSVIAHDGDYDDDDGLIDVGVDGKQDEPTAAEQATALASRLAGGQCAFVDDEHDGSFVTWFKSVVGWKESFKREAKLMCRIADAMRGEGVNIDTSEAFEIVCCRIAALQCMNEGDGSAVADIIEQKHHKSMVPQGVRLAAIKQANMVSRTKSVIRNDNKGDKKKHKKTKNGVTKNTGGQQANKAGGTTGAKK